MKERELIRKREEELEEPDIGNTTLDEIDSEVRRPVGVINVCYLFIVTFVVLSLLLDAYDAVICFFSFPITLL